ncbi:MAG: DUF4337 domain-containing protein [Planctomycetaceae bacterium]|nr:DUF4337 domain-containing protein [Planctomycetaceae bacterium]
MSHGVPHEAQHSSDGLAKQVGLLAGLLAIGLTMVTIASHRTHTHAIVARSEANDLWAYFQSKRIKFHTQELGLDLLIGQGAKGEAADLIKKKLEAERDRQGQESEKIKEQAKEKERESEHAEHRALKFDIAEGLFEIGLVMASMYFLAHRKVFPLVGMLGGVAGSILGIVGLLS